MKITTGNYLKVVHQLPAEGHHIVCHQQNGQVVVYQAYNSQIANDALRNQVLGGSHYSYNRMSWIKPNFLWMMYRCGWASKENQERVLAIWLNKTDWEAILKQAVYSSFNPARYLNHDQWKQELDQKEVRLQWDPDHDPFGAKLSRRAIQIGMKGSVLEAYGKQQIKLIEDITDFVKEQKTLIDKGGLGELRVPDEKVYEITDEDLKRSIGVN